MRSWDGSKKGKSRSCRNLFYNHLYHQLEHQKVKNWNSIHLYYMFNYFLGGYETASMVGTLKCAKDLMYFIFYASNWSDSSWFSGINCCENRCANTSRLKPSFWNIDEMNLTNILFALLYLINVGSADTWRAKGNMRGMATKFSGLSPRQIQIIKRILKAQQKVQHGRFA